MAEKKKRFEKIRKSIKYGLLAGALLHAGTQVAYWANNIYHAINPSVYRAKFEEQFGFPLKGWSDDIEGNLQNVSIIANGIERERMSGGLDVASIRIKDENYFKQPMWDQFGSLFFNPASYCAGKWIVLCDYARRDTLHHECKHAKTWDIDKEHPEFLDRWRDLAKTESGESLYLSIGNQICSRVKGLDFLVNRIRETSSENRRLGFVSDYARTNVWEDIAEVGEAAETNPHALSELLFGEEKENAIAKKIALAQAYKLIPAECTEFLELENMYSNCSGFHGSIDQEKAQSFMKASEEFFRRNPKSVYESELRSNRAYVFLHGMRGWPSPRNTIADAVKEYKKVLTTEYKDGVSYAAALTHLRELYYGWEGYGLEIKDEETSKIFSEAEREYWNRFKNGAVDLSKRGVNDFLIKKGINLEN